MHSRRAIRERGAANPGLPDPALRAYKASQRVSLVARLYFRTTRAALYSLSFKAIATRGES